MITNSAKRSAAPTTTSALVPNHRRAIQNDVCYRLSVAALRTGQRGYAEVVS